MQVQYDDKDEDIEKECYLIYIAFQKFGAIFRDKLLEKTISRRSFSVGGSSPIA